MADVSLTFDFFLFQSSQQYFPPIKASKQGKTPKSLPSHWVNVYQYLKGLEEEKASQIQWPSAFPSDFTANIVIGFAEMRDLCRRGIFDNLQELPGRSISGEEEIEKKKSAKESQKAKVNRNIASNGHDLTAPMITIGLESIMVDRSEALPEESQAIISLDASNFGLDRRYPFLDGSIWHRYISLTAGWQEKLNRLIDELILNYHRGLYHSVVAYEYLELQVRLLRNNYFSDLPSEDGHGKGVNPFSYWSESQMHLKSDKLWKEIFELQSDIQWNCFLVDDFAQQSLRLVKKKNLNIKQGHLPTKGQILFEVANLAPIQCDCKDFLFLANLDDKDNWRIDDLVSDIIRDEDPEIYDIIFLDYYLGAETSSDQRYGYQLLERILQSRLGELPSDPDRQLFRRANPLGKYWLFPISAFPFAFKTHVNARGDENFTQYWNLSDGGNPINSPHHFRMKLYKLLLSQLKSSSLNVRYVLDIIHIIFDAWDFAHIRDKARENYNYFTQLLANFYRISTVNKTSGKGFMENRKISKDGLFITHLEAFIRLLAFAPSQEYFKIEEKLGVLLRIAAQQERDDLFKLLKDIRDHKSVWLNSTFV